MLKEGLDTARDFGTIWPLEPHTLAKHEILAYYLKAWFPILATTHSRLLYVDGFAGPGEYSKGEDGSPIIALKVARDHVQAKKLQRESMELVFLFIEEDQPRCQNLQQRIDALGLPGNFNVRTMCATFEGVFDGILGQIEEQNKRLAPCFVFIDPFGPTGFPMSLVARLAKQPRSEVLVNFNYQALNQWFLEDSRKHGHVDDLYGSAAWRPALQLDDPARRETYLMDAYQSALSTLGWRGRRFRMVNKHNQTQYYLFFATTSPKGMLAMKGAMWSAAPRGDFQYSDLTDPQQPNLFLEFYNHEHSCDLANRLRESRRGQTTSKQALLDSDVAWHPVCIGRHLTEALKTLEDDSASPGIIGVELPGGRKRKKGTYPSDCTIKFAP